MNSLSRPKIIAHRGASGMAPENTLCAIDAALGLKVDYIEIDVRLSKDNIPVVIHDSSLKRTTGLKHAPYIHELNLEEIKRYDVGSWFGDNFSDAKVPTLSEILNSKWENTGLMIEIKKCPQSNKEIVNRVFDAISTSKNLPPALMIGSFSMKIMEEIQKQISHTSIGTKIEPIAIIDKSNLVGSFIESGIKNLAIWYKIASPSLILNLQKRYINTWSFTVDDPKVARFLGSMGIQGLISNHPKHHLELFEGIR